MVRASRWSKILAKIIEIDETGVNAMSLAEIVVELQNRYRKRLGEDLSLSAQTPQAQILGITASVFSEINEAIVEDVSANSIDHAGGLLLTQLGSILDISRTVATRSRVTATLTGVAGTGVPSGSRARTSDGDVFETLSPAVLSPSGVNVDMQALETGPIEAAADSLTEIVTIIPGWETITNANAAAPGIDGQSDENYRLTYQARTARIAAGIEDSILSAIEDARGKKHRIVENKSNVTNDVQQWPIFSHSIAVIVESGSDNDIRRSVDLRRGQGVGTMAVIIGGNPQNGSLDSVTNGTVIWNGVQFTGLNLSSATTAENKAEALTTFLRTATPAADPPVDIRWIDGAYFAFYGWVPGDQPTFSDPSGGDVIGNFGLLAATARAAPGPFARARARDLAVSVDITRQDGFPSDGLNQIRGAISNVVAGYEIGQQAWLNDFLVAIESIPGTRASNLTVTHNSDAVSGIDIPLDSLWTIATNDMTINIT